AQTACKTFSTSLVLLINSLSLQVLHINSLSLQGKVAQTACKHLSTSQLQLLLETDFRQVSMGALQQFNADVKECERFARAGPVPGFQGDTPLLAFSDLRQLLDLFIQWDWSSYLADYGRPTCKYLSQPKHYPALILLLMISAMASLVTTESQDTCFTSHLKESTPTQGNVPNHCPGALGYFFRPEERVPPTGPPTQSGLPSRDRPGPTLLSFSSKPAVVCRVVYCWQ
uniref:Exocyst complex subunit EXOC6/Sec15 C-terminal domain-containing protein n=1 Tax=Salmo trutta TaxID=8032 RepID=A0A673WFR3_SALTR